MPNSCAVKLHRKKQVLAALQPDCSTMVLDLTKDDGGLEVSVAPMIDIEVEMRERDVSRASITNLQGITGKISGSAKISAEYKGAIGSYSNQDIIDNSNGKKNRLLDSLAGGDAKLPALHKYLSASGLTARGAMALPISEIHFSPTPIFAENGVGYIPTGSKIRIYSETTGSKTLANSIVIANGVSTAGSAVIGCVTATAAMLGKLVRIPGAGIAEFVKVIAVTATTNFTLEKVATITGTTLTGEFRTPIDHSAITSVALSAVPAPVAMTGGVAGQPVVTSVGALEIHVGFLVTGTGIPAGTTVLSVVAGASFTLSANLTATAGGNITFIQPASDSDLVTVTPIRINGSEQVVVNYIDRATTLNSGYIGTPISTANAGVTSALAFFKEVDGVEVCVGSVVNAASSNVNYTGYHYAPISSGFQALTIRNEEDSYQRTIYGAMGDVSISVENSDMAKFEFDFKGMLPSGFIYNQTGTTGLGVISALAAGDIVCFGSILPTLMDAGKFVVVQARNANTSTENKELWLAALEAKDDNLASSTSNIVGTSMYRLSANGANWTSVATALVGSTIRKVSHDDFTQTPGVVYDTSVPPTMKNANLVMDGYRPAFTKVDFKLGNSVTIRQSANTQNGFLAGIINSRKPTISLDPELMNRSDYDYFDKWTKGQTAAIEFAVDNGQAGNRFYFYAPKAQYSSGSGNERDGISTIGMDANLVGSSLSSDEEVSLFFY